MKSDFSRTHAHNKEGKEVKGGGVGEPIRNHGGLGTTKVLESVQIPLLLRTVAFITAWEEWIDHRLEAGRQRRWATTVRCFQKAMARCEAMGPDRAVEAIEHSIEMGYRGIFERAKFHVEQSKPRHVQGSIRVDCV